MNYQGPEIDDPEVFGHLPADLRAVLEKTNGYVQFGGGIHVRGACRAPAWHSLREAMEGKLAFHRLYPDIVDPTDIPFAQDCSGDQFLIRGGEIHQLAAEVGEVDPMDIDLTQFLANVQSDPVEALCMHPLLQFQKEGGRMKAGELLLAYPPFCTGKSGSSASVKCVEAVEVITFHAEFAQQIQDMDDGEEFVMNVTE